MNARVTESLSPFTSNGSLELFGVSAALRALRSVDGGLFFGHGPLPGLLDDSTLSRAARLSEAIRLAVSAPHGRVCFVGCGTSGRLSQFHARGLNACAAAARAALGLPARDVFSYILAGGDAAAVLPQEAAEDSPSAAVAAFAAWDASTGAGSGGGGGGHTVVLGISCGLSARFVFTVVECARRAADAQWLVALLGFNPVEAMAAPLPDLHAVLEALEAATLEGSTRGGVPWGALLLNPSLGPEAVAGSSRMKGGSATSILVQSVSLVACAAAAAAAPAAARPSLEHALRECVLAFSEAAARTYAHVHEGSALALLVSAAGRALAVGGRVIYVGAGTAGALALTDASECPPTYGARFRDVMGFVVGGFEAVLGRAAAAALPPLLLPAHLRCGDGGACAAKRALEEALEALPVAVDVEGAFLGRVVPSLSPHDLVIGVGIDGEASAEGGAEGAWARVAEAVRAAAAAGAATAELRVLGHAGGPRGGPFQASRGGEPPLAVHVALSATSLPCAGGLPAPPALAQLALKLCLNATSTLGHAAAGCIWGGRMVAMCITNEKLFHRAVGIVVASAGVAQGAAEAAVLRAINGGTGATRTAAEHVAAAAGRRGVLPLALLVAAAAKAGRVDALSEAQEALRRERVVGAAAAAMGLQLVLPTQ
jgi:N-acetylmuramic acid 6-phosphate (MurNAc-6-P) etherase